MRSAPATGQLAVLVIEDDEAIGQALHSGLRGSGYAAVWCRTGGAGLVESRRSRPDVVLLDLGLPDLDGTEVARRLRAESPDVLLIIVTARGDEIDVIAGLDAGADDYLVKPFSRTVLLARIRAHLRRRPVGAGPGGAVRVADLRIDAAARRCTVGDIEIALRPKEFELLDVLVRNVGAAVSREDLMAQVWDENWFGSTKTLDVTMVSLRRRLQEAVAASPRPVHVPEVTTLRGHGYRLDKPVEVRSSGVGADA